MGLARRSFFWARQEVLVFLPGGCFLGSPGGASQTNKWKALLRRQISGQISGQISVFRQISGQISGRRCRCFQTKNKCFRRQISGRRCRCKTAYKWNSQTNKWKALSLFPDKQVEGVAVVKRHISGIRRHLSGRFASRFKTFLISTISHF